MSELGQKAEAYAYKQVQQLVKDGHTEVQMELRDFDETIREIYTAGYTEAMKGQRWIPVSERLPGIDEDVLIYPESARSKIFYFNGNGWEYEGFKHDLNRFTHWQPLPQPPQGGR
jgi:hypothetical protein